MTGLFLGSPHLPLRMRLSDFTVAPGEDVPARVLITHKGTTVSFTLVHELLVSEVRIPVYRLLGLSILHDGWWSAR